MVIALHDRCVAGTRGNIDALVVCAARHPCCGCQVASSGRCSAAETSSAVFGSRARRSIWKIVGRLGQFGTGEVTELTVVLSYELPPYVGGGESRPARVGRLTRLARARRSDRGWSDPLT